MAAHVSVNVHADTADLNADRYNQRTVVLVAGPAALFFGSKTATLAALAHWVELVEALPDDEAV